MRIHEIFDFEYPCPLCKDDTERDFGKYNDGDCAVCDGDGIVHASDHTDTDRAVVDVRYQEFDSYRVLQRLEITEQELTEGRYSECNSIDDIIQTTDDEVMENALQSLKKHK